MSILPNIPVTNTILDFIKELKKYNTAKEAIKNIFNEDNDAIKIYKIANKTLNLKSKQGFIYELLWDICIKLNITELTDIYEPHNNIQHLIGNVNNKNSTFQKINDFFNDYLQQKYISGNSGGYSDITFTTKENDITTLYLSSAKYFTTDKKKDIKKYDIQNLCTIIKEREKDNYDEIKTLLFVKNKKDFIKICKDANQSSNVLIRYISPNGNYENVYDLNDLEKHYTRLYKILEDFNFLKDIDNFNEKYLKKIKKKFIPRFHQELFIEKIKYLIHKDQKKILVGAIPRSGKTFIMAGTILADVIIENKKNQDKTYNNYVIITPAPNETMEQYFKAFDDYYDFINNDIVPINVKGEKEDSDEFKGHKNKHNVFLISKQRLGFKDNIDNDETLTYNMDDIKTIKKNIKKYFGTKQPRIIFFDEAHFGMSTSIAQNIFKELDKEDKSYKIYVTATYSKPKQIYGVTDGNIIKWDLNDIKMIKNIKNKKALYSTISNFQIKFGTKILNRVLTKNGINDDTLNKAPFIFNNKINTIIDQYKHFPEPYLITSVWDKNFIKEELKLLTSSTPTFGFDMHKLFMPTKNNQFANKEQLIQLLEYYFGYLTYKDDTPDYYNRKNEYKKRGIIPIIEEVCTNYCRTLQPQHKTTQLWFLPPYNISKIVRALLLLLKDKFNYIFESYMFYIAVDDKTAKKYNNIQYMSEPKNIKKEIEELEKKLYTNGDYKKYNGLIILAGNRLQLGISLKNVDIVSLFTNITASDAIYQMLFRSMTEIDDDIECDGINYCGRKRYGFMVDLNPQRTLYTIDYLTDMYLDYNNKQTKTSKYELIADLINIDKHKFIDKYNREDKKGYQKYVKEFFDKLITEWDAKSDIITDSLVKSDIFDNEIFTSNFDITTLFTKIENVKGLHKKAIHKPDDQLPVGKTKETKKLEDVVKKEKKPLDIKKLWANLFAEIISILSLITSYSDDDGNECIFNNNDSLTNFIYYIDTILKKMEESDDKTIKEIFLYTLKKRIITNNIDDDDLYNMIYNIILILKDKEQTGGDLSDINKQIQFRKRVIYNIKEPDKLLEFINDNLKPKIIEKQERGEVFTPIPIVNEMLDELNKLPENVWENKDLKWLDPAAGMGNFPVAIYMRLMKGLETVIKDQEARRKHILNEMLYMVELDKTNVFMMKKIFCGGKYKLNIFQGSFIEGDYNDDIFTSRITLKDNIAFMKKIKTFESKFDIAIGNPPYNDNKESPIYNLFIEKLLNNIKPIYILLIVPSRWFSGGKGLDNFRNMMLNRTDIKMIRHYDDSQEVFGNDVDITGGINYFLIDRNYNGLCEFNSIDIKLNRYDILISNPDIYTLIDKMIKYASLAKIYKRNYYNITTNDKRLVTEKVNDNYIVCYVNQQMGFRNYIDKKLITKDINSYKVLTTESNGDRPTFGNIIIKEPNQIHSQTYISFDVKNKKEADSLVSYLKCKLANYMLSLKKNTQHISEKTINWIPLPPLDRIWTDENIYEYFKITSKEKKLINDNTKDIK